MQALEKEKLHDTSFPTNVSPSLSKEIPRQEKQMGKNDERWVHQSWGNHLKQKYNDHALFNENEDNKVVALVGNEVIASSQHFVQGETDTEGWKQQQRRWLGSTLEDAKEMINDSKEDDATEDIVVMDYAQPQRKPPIHNRKC
ncbi:hypothetical protein U1Q18_019407 [Sarracenia purpurea var. burkii]